MSVKTCTFIVLTLYNFFKQKRSLFSLISLVRCPLPKRIILGKSKSDNNNRKILFCNVLGRARKILLQQASDSITSDAIKRNN